MDRELMSLVVSGISHVASEFIRYRPIKLNKGPASMQPTEVIRFAATSEADPPMPSSLSTIDKPTTEETISMLEKRLNQSIIDLQPDLIDGARINGKPCDCLKKHTDEMLGAVRELQSMANKPAYSKIREWAESHNWTADEVAQHPPEFFVSLTPDLRMLRKELTGSELALSAKPELVPTPSPAITQMRELAKQVQDGKMSKEEAVGKIKAMMGTRQPST